MGSIGTLFFVSCNSTKNPILRIQPAKKKNTKARILHNIVKNARVMRKVKSMFELTAEANPAVLVSRGNVSLGINQPRGPQDHAKDITNEHTCTTTMAACTLVRVLVVIKASKIAPTAVCITKTFRSEKQIVCQKRNTSVL
jgi:hypothetical protein